MVYTPPPELAGMSLARIAEEVAARRLPPVEQWAPTHEGDSEMRIAADGRWYHQGGAIARPAMVRAFASLLTRDEDGQHWLVTPYQRLSIALEDAAFIAVDVSEHEGQLAFRLNTDELVIAGPDHPLRIEGSGESPAAYLGVRRGLEARLDRSTWLQLAELAREDAQGWHVASGGARFALEPA